MKFHSSLVLAAVTILSGCSGGGGDSAGTPDPYVFEINPEVQEKLDTWKNKVYKTCDVSSIFSNSSDDRGIDRKQFLDANKGSMIIREDQEFAILSGFNPPSGFSTRSIETSVSINGKTSTLKARSERVGPTCSIFLFDKLVFKTDIYESANVGIHWNADKKVSEKVQNFKAKEVGKKGIQEIDSRELSQTLQNIVKPTKDVHAFLDRKFGFRNGFAASLFKDQYYDFSTAVNLSNSSLWNTIYYPDKYLMEASIAQIFERGYGVLPGHMRIYSPIDNEYLKLSFALILNKTGSTQSLEIKDVHFEGVVPEDEPEALSCIKDRFSALVHPLVLTSYGKKILSPSISEVFSGCEDLHRTVRLVAFEKGQMKLFIPLIFRGVSPARDIIYSGWDEELMDFALTLLQENKDIRTLDPYNQTVIVGVLSDNLENFKQAISMTTLSAELKRSLFQLGIKWSFAGERSAPSQVSKLVAAAANAGEVFKNSFERLLQRLVNEPHDFNSQIDFALQINETYKTEALKAKALASDIEYTAFERLVFDSIIMKMTPISELREWITKLTFIQTSNNRYQNLGSIKEELNTLAFKWMDSGVVSKEDLHLVYSSLNNVATFFPESSRNLLREIEQLVRNQKDVLFFIRDLNDDYKKSALNVNTQAKKAGFESWGKDFIEKILLKRPTLLEVKKMEEMWISISAFSLREEERVKGSHDNNDWYKKPIIETAIKETWANKDFLTLEAIAMVASHRYLCNHYKGMSGLASCLGAEKFNKKKGNFLDPEFNHRYLEFAPGFAEIMKRLGGSSNSSFAHDLYSRFSEVIWNKCDQTAFHQRSTQFYSQMNAYWRETSTSKKWEIERTVKTLTENCK
jgi:hypothetical protein